MPSRSPSRIPSPRPSLSSRLPFCIQHVTVRLHSFVGNLAGSNFSYRRASHPCRHSRAAHNEQSLRGVRVGRSGRDRDAARKQGRRAFDHAQARGRARCAFQQDGRDPAGVQAEHDCGRRRRECAARDLGQPEDASGAGPGFAQERQSFSPLCCVVECTDVELLL